MKNSISLRKKLNENSLYTGSGTAEISAHAIECAAGASPDGPPFTLASCGSLASCGVPRVAL